MVDCLKCINSACCKDYDISVDKADYDRLVGLGLKDHIISNTEKFLKKWPQYDYKEKEIGKLFGDDFASLKKGKDGYCELLDRKTMLCSIHQDRPRVCAEYTTDRCVKIRLLQEDN